jgi:hypothetical protein
MGLFCCTKEEKKIISGIFGSKVCEFELLIFDFVVFLFVCLN